MELNGIVAKMAEKVKQNKRKIVLPETEDKRVLKAAAIVATEDIADIVLIGNKEDISNVCNAEGIDMPYDKIEIIDSVTDPKKRIMQIYYMN